MATVFSRLRGSPRLRNMGAAATSWRRGYNFASAQYDAAFDRAGVPEAGPDFCDKLRADTIAYIDKFDPKSWSNDPVTTLLRGKALTEGVIETTVDAFGSANGSVIQATPEQVDAVLKHLRSYAPPQRDNRAAVRAMEAEIFDVLGGSPWPAFLVGNQALHSTHVAPEKKGRLPPIHTHVVDLPSGRLDTTIHTPAPGARLQEAGRRHRDRGVSPGAHVAYACTCTCTWPTYDRSLSRRTPCTCTSTWPTYTCTCTCTCACACTCAPTQSPCPVVGHTKDSTADACPPTAGAPHSPLQANIIEQRLSDQLLADEAAGVVAIGRAPALVGCVSNFSNFLDLCRKVLRNLELGVPVLVLSRSNTAQHTFRWVQMLVALGPKHGIDPGMVSPCPSPTLARTLTPGRTSARTPALTRVSLLPSPSSGPRPNLTPRPSPHPARDPRQVSHLAASLSEQQRLVAAASPASPFYFTGSRPVARSIRAAHPNAMASTGGPNTLVSTQLTPEVPATLCAPGPCPVRPVILRCVPRDPALCTPWTCTVSPAALVDEHTHYEAGRTQSRRGVCTLSPGGGGSAPLSFH